MKNLFHDIAKELPEEAVEVLVETSGHRIERIVSQGHASPEGFWYDQDQNEWVIVLKGLRSCGSTEMMKRWNCDPLISSISWAHKRHRVEWTAPDEPTIWLAVFYGG